MPITRLASGFLLTLALYPVTDALADNAETANKSNNPLNLAPGLNLQDYYTPQVYDSNIHTFVQHLVDTGKITAEEAEHHPQRSVVMRVTRSTCQPRPTNRAEARAPGSPQCHHP